MISSRYSNITRPDLSKFDLEKFKRDGYSQVVFVSNPTSKDEKCDFVDGNIYEIDELLKLDNPAFRITHPNTRGEFVPYEPSKKQNEQQANPLLEQTNEQQGH